MKTEHKVIALSIIFGIFIYLIDVVLEYFFLYKRTFWGLPFSDAAVHDLLHHLVIIVCFVIFGLLILRTLTKPKHVEKAPEEKIQWLSTTLDSISDAVITTDVKGIVTFINPVAQSLTGWQRKEASGKHFRQVFKIIDEKTRRVCDNPIEKVIKSGAIVRLAKHIVLITKDKKERFVAADCLPIRNKDGQIIGAALIFREITEKLHLQEFITQSQRLETAGRIAGQIAHDFNNLLGPLIAYPDFIRETLPTDHPAIQYIEDMEKSAERMSEINQQLMTFGRRGHYTQEPMNLNDVIRDVVSQMYPTPDTLVIETDLSKNLMNIKGGRSQIFKVISNLVTNAREAMQNVGRLTIKSENYYVDKISDRFGRVPKGEYVKLAISDTGCGIAEDIVLKIFDPFFTTKTTDKERGSGLSLSVVHAVVEDHNGFIDIDTTVGKGTTFYLYFPITREAIEEIENDRIIGGTENILVVDDDPIQRDVALNLLTKLGYKAHATDSGEKALDFIKENPQDLILLDMIMPGGINGAETYKRALEINPNQRAIIVSGYTETDRVKKAINLGAGAFIQKPLTLKTIAHVMRKELGRKP